MQSAENRPIFRNLQKVVTIVVDGYEYNSKNVGGSHDQLLVYGVKEGEHAFYVKISIRRFSWPPEIH